MSKDIKHIQIEAKVHERLYNLGKKGETYSEVIERLIDYFELHTGVNSADKR